MAKKKTYEQYLREELGSLVEQLKLPNLYKQSLKQRWLDQLVWADKKADQCRRMHYRLRLTTIISGVVLPALVGVNMQLPKDTLFSEWFRYVPFFLSQVIAVSAALEEFYRYGDRWRDYRKMAEELKAEGWQYVQLSGPYENLGEHIDGYANFASRVESIIKNDVQNYIATLQQQQAKENEQIKQIIKTANTFATDDQTLLDRPAPVGLAQQQQQQLWGTPAPAFAAAGAAGILQVRQNTEFKLSPQHSSLLPDNSKIWVDGGNSFGLMSYVQADNNHLQVAIDRGLGPENRNVWFVGAPDVAIVGNIGSSAANLMATPAAPAPMMAATAPAPSPIMSDPPPAPTAPLAPCAPAASNGAIKLPVPFFSQRDNREQGDGTCNTSSCAMVAKFLGANISGDDEYFQYVIKYGETTDESAQTQALAELKIQSTWNTTLDFDDLDKSLASGLPAVIGIRHRGEASAPIGGGHMIVAIGRNADGDYIINDPYGNLLDGYVSEDGGGLTYSRQELSRRWTADGPKTGWGRLFYGNNPPGTSAQNAPAQTAPAQTAQTLFASGTATAASPTASANI